MRNFTHTNPYYCDPPGSFVEILSHPTLGGTKAIQQATFNEHRFSFYYWQKWWKELRIKYNMEVPPTLVSIDYHRDLAGPDDIEKLELLEVEDYNLSDLGLFCWAKMNSLNDGHILSAAYLNIVGDIILLKQQEGYDEEEALYFKDHYGNKHNIFEFDEIDKFEEFILKYKTDRIFFDIDLDYFISNVGNYMDGKGYIVMSNKEISDILNPDRNYMRKIYNALEGITIATEPKHCGGMLNSNKILSTIEATWFSDGKVWK